MCQQADAVRAGGALNAGLRGDEGLHYIQVSQHGRRENRRVRSVVKQELRNWTVAHVRRCSECALPIAKSPIPRRLCQGWMCAYEFLDAREVEVGDGHHLSHQVGSLRGIEIGWRDDRGCTLRNFY